MTSPCNGCPDVGCGAYHDQCKEYQEYVRKRQARYGGDANKATYCQYKQKVIEKALRRRRA